MQSCIAASRVAPSLAARPAKATRRSAVAVRAEGENGASSAGTATAVKVGRGGEPGPPSQSGSQPHRASPP